MRTGIRLLAFLTLSMALHCPVLAQDGGDSFEDDPFAAQQGSMPRRQNRGGAQWRPSTYNDQNAVIQAMLGSQIKRNLKYRFESVGVLSDGLHSPSWFTSNRQGLASVKTKSAYARYGMFGEMRLPSAFGMKYGMDLGLGYGLHDDWFVQQLYIDVDYRAWSLSVGMKERWAGLSNPELGSGSLTWSGNSTPIPQARLGLPEYTRLGILGNWFSVKGHVAYGMYTDGKYRSSVPDGVYTDGIFYHSKEAYIRFGDRERFPLELTLGLQMHAQFGGVKHNREKDADGNLVEEYRLPGGLKSAWNILLPFNKPGEQTSENGNTLGSWLLGLDWHLPQMTIRLYYDHFYEDHSSLLGIEYKSDETGYKHFVNYGFRRNWLDGLYGLEFIMPDEWPVRDVVIEVLNTRGLCGAVYNPKGSDYIQGVDGRDNMYNHIDVYDSYSHYGFSIGSPMLISPVYNGNGMNSFASNRVNMFHMGLEGGVGRHLDYQVKLTAARHWGTYEYPFDRTRDVTSAMVRLMWLAGDNASCRIGVSYGIDRDDSAWLGNNRGVMLSVIKTWKVL